MARVPWQSGILLPTPPEKFRLHSKLAGSFARLSESRLFGLDFGDWFVLLGGSALIGLVTLLV